MHSDRGGERGFTMIEALVALVLVSATLAGIGSLAATTANGTRTLEQRVALIQTARAISAVALRRDDLAAGIHGGVVSGHRWEARLSAVLDPGALVPDSPWVPTYVTVRVRSPAGAIHTVETIRLLRRPR